MEAQTPLPLQAVGMWPLCRERRGGELRGTPVLRASGHLAACSPQLFPTCQPSRHSPGKNL